MNGPIMQYKNFALRLVDRGTAGEVRVYVFEGKANVYVVDDSSASVNLECVVNDGDYRHRGVRDRLLGQLEDFTQSSPAAAATRRTTDASYQLMQQRMDLLEAKVASSIDARTAAVAARVSSWLYQVVSPTLDAIEDMLVSWRFYLATDGDATTTTTIHPRWNRAVRRDLMASDVAMRALFESIEAFRGNVGQSIEFYERVRVQLLEFAVDACGRLGIPPAPR